MWIILLSSSYTDEPGLSASVSTNRPDMLGGGAWKVDSVLTDLVFLAEKLLYVPVSSSWRAQSRPNREKIKMTQKKKLAALAPAHLLLLPLALTTSLGTVICMYRENNNTALDFDQPKKGSMGSLNLHYIVWKRRLKWSGFWIFLISFWCFSFLSSPWGLVTWSWPLIPGTF